MRLGEIRREADFQALKLDWNALLGESVSHSIFLTWEWITAWWSAYGDPGKLRILAAYDDSDVLRGIAPLREGTARKYGQTVSTLTFLVDGSNDSDYLDFIAASGWEDRVSEEFRGYLEEELKRGVVLVLNDIPETSFTLPLLKKLSTSQGRVSTAEDVPCAAVRLPSSWDD